MALVIRGTAENSASNGGNVTVTHPGGTATNDVVYLAYAISNATDFNMATSTGGYTELADLYADATLMDANLGVFRKVMGGTPDSNVTVTGTGLGADSTAAVVHVWTGADTTTPEDATTTTASAAGSTIPNSPSIVTVTANAIVLTLGAGSINDSTVTAPTGYSNQVDIDQIDTNRITVCIASKAIASPTTEDPAAWTDFTDGTNRGWCAATVAIRPAAAADILFAQSIM